MFRHHFRGSLFAQAAEAPDAAGALSELGTPFEIPLGEPEPKADEKPAGKSDVEKQLEQLKADVTARDRRIEELSQSEKFWSNKARGTATPEVPQPDPDDDDDPAPGVSPFEGEKPDKFLDDVSAEGLGALLKRGVITQTQFDGALSKLEERITRKVEERLTQHAQHTAMDAKFNEFPELLADSKRVAAGEQPQSELYKRTRVHYQAMVADDPALKNSVGATLAAARLAKKELDLEAKGRNAESRSQNGQQGRRERIQAQGGERAPAGGSEDDLGGGDELSPQAREVIGHLGRHLEVRDLKTKKVTMTGEDNFRRHMGRNGRG